MDRVASFSVDHTKLKPGLYLSRRDGDIVTLDLRFKRPNTGDLLSNSELHSVEHLVGSLLRSGEHQDAIVYFGPMGCQTGFYFLYDSRRLSDAGAVALLRQVFAQAAGYEGEIPGKSERECGNFRNLDAETARRVCAWYAGLISDWTAENLAY